MARNQKRTRFDRSMPPGAIGEWLDKMGISQRDAVALLGISRSGLRNYDDRGAPLYIALACAALLNDIKPYGIKRDVISDIKKEIEEKNERWPSGTRDAWLETKGG